ncbi:hypothetical protein PoB_002925900 [Plakobranchus ocellatus]|uniref:Secreted protein n=1 Tax=Plakobranchus ocellatus TaxID=259542 RepID=A0AAV4A8H4_9GAST|nr:hypothetical protein PoB_002925900 [Plakobranchus ocellatus]
MKVMLVFMVNIKFISMQMIVMMDSSTIPRQTDANDEGVREECNGADGQPLLNNGFMNLERLILCLAENENTHVYEELPEGKKKNCFFHN